MTQHNGYVLALLEERRGYVARGLTARVAHIDQVLARIGIAVETASVDPELETASIGTRKRRKSVRDADN